MQKGLKTARYYEKRVAHAIMLHDARALSLRSCINWSSMLARAKYCGKHIHITNHTTTTPPLVFLNTKTNTQATQHKQETNKTTINCRARGQCHPALFLLLLFGSFVVHQQPINKQQHKTNKSNQTNKNQSSQMERAELHKASTQA